ncbi:tetraprenyl-beta-curcumene synthase family protein [Alkalicella caledoniensis]|uniref:Tetraprenyl-beta-curcumene synthase family protein n=1 Tax=Alkalicella caledoniensis TaxID=2731377 RepID=A0A7G9WC50_ALKCA|nr:tetraprenyl-beta-curcumene synthase family protein [Alkalicella caledoniensis]QNO16262.1 tetraprenyl-beta-curcumene synthase family protein [Alkalicella caledoniensis]
MIKSFYKFLMLTPYVLSIFPEVKKNLKTYKDYLNQCPNSELTNQACLSIENKDFHSLGGGVYGLGCKKVLPFITSFQTISDYLDNLCDRAGVCDEEGFRILHKSMLDALSPTKFTPDYYENYPLKGDGGYLAHLVENCQHTIETLPSFPIVRQYTLKLTELYKDLQVFKHLDPTVREDKLISWADSHQATLAPELYWWEFSAATGSTLPTFALIREAAKKDLTSEYAKKVYEAYFPYVAGLHILLDYFIDKKEDEIGGDLNFVSYYETENQLKQRLCYFIKNSLEKVRSLPNNNFHETVVKGLLAMYLSDPKVKQDNLESLAMDLLNFAGSDTKAMYKACITLRKKNKL